MMGLRNVRSRGYAVCGSGLTDYKEVRGTPFNVGPNGAREISLLHCPDGMRILGGGQWISGPLFFGAGEYTSATAECPAGTVLYGGGGGSHHPRSEPGMTITDSYRSGENAWTVYSRSHPANHAQGILHSTVICGS
ncbi:hypothetical protein [Nonomuraea sediminis]|uniref:hypothetical protein n=1 Tax=Nonomuraea sediminis TaxID=2835864 RepID=UPI001BDD9C86|nr:hypothetical protein [Nonomuraea sediminis]